MKILCLLFWKGRVDLIADGCAAVTDTTNFASILEGGGTSLASDGGSCVHKGSRCSTKKRSKSPCTHSPSPSFLGSSLSEGAFCFFEPCK